MDPVLRATTGTGDVYDDPSEDLLFMLFEDFEEADPTQRWFTLERLEPGRHGAHLRVYVRDDDTFGFEGPDADGIGAIESMRAAHEAVTRWAFDLPDPPERAAGEAPKALGIGVIVDLNPANARWRTAIRELQLGISKAASDVDAPLRITVVFQIPGRNWKPDFAGIRMGDFTKNDAHLGFDVALDESVPPDPATAVKQAVYAAIDQAEAWAQERGVAPNLSSLREILDRLE